MFFFSLYLEPGQESIDLAFSFVIVLDGSNKYLPHSRISSYKKLNFNLKYLLVIAIIRVLTSDILDSIKAGFMAQFLMFSSASVADH